MNREEIKLLLEKYYNCESTLEDENKLKKFFSQNDIQEEYKAEQEIFRYYIQSSGIPEPSSGLENRIITALDDVESQTGKVRTGRIYVALSGIAAALLILTGIYFFFNGQTEIEDTFSDPEIAYAEAMKILYDVSEKLNQGTKGLEQLNMLQEETIKGIKTINKSTSNMIEKMGPISDMLDNMERADTANLLQ